VRSSVHPFSDEEGTPCTRRCGAGVVLNSFHHPSCLAIAMRPPLILGEGKMKGTKREGIYFGVRAVLGW